MTARDARIAGEDAQESARTLAIVLGLAIALVPTVPTVAFYLLLRRLIALELEESVRAFARGAAWLIVRLRWPILLAWVLATIAGIVYLPSLEDAGDETSLIGLVPEERRGHRDRPAKRGAVRRSRDHAHASRATKPKRPFAGGGSPRRTTCEADRGRARPRALARSALRSRSSTPAAWSRARARSGTTAITYLFFDPSETDLDDQEELTARFTEKYVRFEDDNLVGITGARTGADRGVAADRERLAVGDARDGRADRARARNPLPIADRAARDALRRRGRLSGGMRWVAWIGEWLDVSIPREAEPILIVLLLGVVTDYAVFFLHGLRERLDAGEPRLDGGGVGDGRVRSDRRDRGLDRRRGHGRAAGRRARVLPRLRPRAGDDRAGLARGLDDAAPGVDGDPRRSACSGRGGRDRESAPAKAGPRSRTSQPRDPWRS